MPDQHCGSDMHKLMIWLWVKQNVSISKWNTSQKMFVKNNSYYNRIEHDKDDGAVHCGVRGTQEPFGTSGPPFTNMV